MAPKKAKSGTVYGGGKPRTKQEAANQAQYMADRRQYEQRYLLNPPSDASTAGGVAASAWQLESNPYTGAYQTAASEVSSGGQYYQHRQMEPQEGNDQRQEPHAAQPYGMSYDYQHSSFPAYHSPGQVPEGYMATPDVYKPSAYLGHQGFWSGSTPQTGGYEVEPSSENHEGSRFPYYTESAQPSVPNNVTAYSGFGAPLPPQYSAGMGGSSATQAERRLASFVLPELKGAQHSLSKVKCSSPKCGRPLSLIFSQTQSSRIKHRIYQERKEQFRCCDLVECFKDMNTNHEAFLLASGHTLAEATQITNVWLRDNLLMRCTACPEPHDTWMGDDTLDQYGCSPDPRNNTHSEGIACARAVTAVVLEELSNLRRNNPGTPTEDFLTQERALEQGIRTAFGQEGLIKSTLSGNSQQA